eukprot:scaffold14330_cov80-Cyclotella_meneghiniana.AAC.4
MASEAERDAILAEYKAAASAGLYDDDDDDDDDEADFDPGDDSDGSNASEEGEPDYAILEGTLSLNDEGRLIYSGTWSMKSDPNKYSKFKLRSQDAFHSKEQLMKSDHGEEKQDGPKKASPLLFDFSSPTQTNIDKSNGSDDVTTRRNIMFDGFFFVKSDNRKEEPGDRNGEHKSKEKIKERDVEIFFQQKIDSTQNSISYEVTGRGYNAYGPFVLEGKYFVPKSNQSQAVMELEKTYGSGGSAKDTNVARGSKRKSLDSDDDVEEEYEEKAGFSELIELTEDANLSVEELRKKYYGGGMAEEESDADGGGGKMPSKRARLEESDDSDCGF